MKQTSSHSAIWVRFGRLFYCWNHRTRKHTGKNQEEESRLKTVAYELKRPLSPSNRFPPPKYYKDFFFISSTGNFHFDEGSKRFLTFPEGKKKKKRRQEAEKSPDGNGLWGASSSRLTIPQGSQRIPQSVWKMLNQLGRRGGLVSAGPWSGSVSKNHWNSWRNSEAKYCTRIAKNPNFNFHSKDEREG